MGKGDLTRKAILERGLSLASRVGIEGLTIGALAETLELSKSGLYAHFKSKEALQLQVLELAIARFTEVAVRPALAAPRGEPRVRALFDRWFRWVHDSRLAGCPFVALATELDDRPGAVRERLVQAQKDWLDVIATCFRTGISEGHFRRNADPDQFAQDLYGIYLAHHHAARLLRDPKSEKRARAAFEALLRAVRTKAA
ncbi:MAG TPA: TetR/AcrR family transcriptional regulator [Vicinamibacteria bacterium]|jgi:AcrR family transcriptional regulator